MIFSAFERLIAWRYLLARRQEGFISVMAVFSFLGIFLWVATLIIVMSVMNGFRHELLGRILGFNGHITIYSSAHHPFDPCPPCNKKFQKSLPSSPSRPSLSVKS